MSEFSKPAEGRSLDQMIRQVFEAGAEPEEMYVSDGSAVALGIKPGHYRKNDRGEYDLVLDGPPDASEREE